VYRVAAGRQGSPENMHSMFYFEFEFGVNFAVRGLTQSMCTIIGIIPFDPLLCHGLCAQYLPLEGELKREEWSVTRALQLAFVSLTHQCVDFI